MAAAGVLVRLRDDDSPSRSSRVPAEEVVHLHGIGLNPADGQLYVASHTGVLTTGPDGELVRVGDRYQDTMGFTVLGPDTFLGSGHPDLREDAPRSLGLIRSEDAAENWEPVSLYGEADLHAIVSAHDRIYAADATAGQLIVSTDEGRSWQRRGEVELAALAVDPSDPNRLVGSDYAGSLHRSEDGGLTWQPVDGPTVTTLAWGAEVGLLGAGPEGDVHASADGVTWEEVGRIDGSGPVITIVDGVVWAAADGARFVHSDDGGLTWTATDRSSS
ncbi:MAG TPA: hypothetical protein VIR58_16855 [Acidimicrobiales bacterium]